MQRQRQKPKRHSVGWRGGVGLQDTPQTHPWGLDGAIHGANGPASPHRPTSDSFPAASRSTPCVDEICQISNQFIHAWRGSTVSTKVDTYRSRALHRQAVGGCRPLVGTSVRYRIPDWGQSPLRSNGIRPRADQRSAPTKSRGKLSKAGWVRLRGREPHGPEACLGRVGQDAQPRSCRVRRTAHTSKRRPSLHGRTCSVPLNRTHPAIPRNAGF